MISRKTIQTMFVAAAIALAGAPQTSFAGPAGVAVVNKADSGKGQPCWVTAWVLWVTTGTLI